MDLFLVLAKLQATQVDERDEYLKGYVNIVVPADSISEASSLINPGDTFDEYRIDEIIEVYDFPVDVEASLNDELRNAANQARELDRPVTSTIYTYTESDIQRE